MVQYSDKTVRCNFCMATFPREDGIVYSFPGNADTNIVELCPECEKGHLWLLNLKVDEEQLKKDKEARANPPLRDKIRDGIYGSDRDLPDRPPNFGTRLGKGFDMLGNDE